MPQERHEASECSEACPYSFVANLRNAQELRATGNTMPVLGCERRRAMSNHSPSSVNFAKVANSAGGCAQSKSAHVAATARPPSNLKAVSDVHSRECLGRRTTTTLRRHAALRRGVSAKPLPKGAGVWHSEIPIGLMYLLEPRYAFPPSHNRMSIPYDYGYSLSSSVKPTSCHPTSQSLDVQVYSCRLLLLVGSAVWS